MDSPVGLIIGEPVTVLRPTIEFDELGEPTEGDPAREEVSPVVVVPGATSDLDATRPAGVEVAYTLCLPKTYRIPLRGCDVIVRGERLRVVGDPRPYTVENTPTPWNYTAEVTRVDG